MPFLSLHFIAQSYITIYYMTQLPDLSAWEGKRYYAYTTYLKKKYGGRVQKVSLNASFTCPNRDGSIGRGGCTFCNNDSFTPSYLAKTNGITEQLDIGLRFLERRYPKTKRFVGYFQAYSNTYGTLDYLKEVYAEALAHPSISGLVIGTRPDCVTDEQLDYLQELAKEHMIVLEYGIESCYDDILEQINRGHTFACTQDAIHRSVGRGFHVGGHMLFGLPGEGRERTLAQAEMLSALPLDSVKFHQLQIVKGTIMAHQYKQDNTAFELFGTDEYIDFVVSFLERLRPDIAIQRFSSEVPPSLKIAPDWGYRLDEIQKMVEQRLIERNTWQGRLYKLNASR